MFPHYFSDPETEIRCIRVPVRLFQKSFGHLFSNRSAKLALIVETPAMVVGKNKENSALCEALLVVFEILAAERSCPKCSSQNQRSALARKTDDFHEPT